MATREFDSERRLERVRQHDQVAAAALVETPYPLAFSNCSFTEKAPNPSWPCQ
jgi:hypothetical protein